MARSPKTTADFIEKVRLRLLWPSSESAWPLTRAQLLSLASDLLESRVWPLYKDAVENYLTCTLDFPVTDPTTFEAGHMYTVPSESFLRVERVWHVDGQGSERELDRYDRSNLPRTFVGAPTGYFFEGGRIGLSPAPRTGFVRISFNALPQALVHYDDSGVNTFRRISAYSGDNITTVGNLPAGWIATEDYIVLSGHAPHVPVAYIDAANVTGHATNVLQVNSAVQWPSSTKANRAPIKPGDLLVEGYDIPVLQVSAEGFAWLCSLLEEAVLDGRTDSSKKSVLMDRLNREQAAFQLSLQPRDASGQVYVPEDRAVMTDSEALRWSLG